MSDVTIEVETPETEPPAPEVIADTGSDDVVMDATTITLVERVTRIEDALAIVTTSLETLTQDVAALATVDEVQQMEIETMAEEQIAEEVEEETPEPEPEPELEPEPEQESEPPADELPTAREHMYFRKWGRRK